MPVLPSQPDDSQNTRHGGIYMGLSWPSTGRGRASPPQHLLSNDAVLADLILLHLQAVLAHMQAVAFESILESNVLQQSEICPSHSASMCLALHGKLLILLRASFLDTTGCWPENYIIYHLLELA